MAVPSSQNALVLPGNLRFSSGGVPVADLTGSVVKSLDTSTGAIVYQDVDGNEQSGTIALVDVFDARNPANLPAIATDGTDDEKIGISREGIYIVDIEHTSDTSASVGSWVRFELDDGRTNDLEFIANYRGTHTADAAVTHAQNGNYYFNVTDHRWRFHSGGHWRDMTSSDTGWVTQFIGQYATRQDALDHAESHGITAGSDFTAYIEGPRTSGSDSEEGMWDGKVLTFATTAGTQRRWALIGANISTAQIQDGAVTLPKLGDDVVLAELFDARDPANLPAIASDGSDDQKVGIGRQGVWVVEITHTAGTNATVDSWERYTSSDTSFRVAHYGDVAVASPVDEDFYWNYTSQRWRYYDTDHWRDMRSTDPGWLLNFIGQFDIRQHALNNAAGHGITAGGDFVAFIEGPTGERGLFAGRSLTLATDGVEHRGWHVVGSNINEADIQDGAVTRTKLSAEAARPTVPERDATITYGIGEQVRTDQGEVYISLADDNTAELSDDTQWGHLSFGKTGTVFLPDLYVTTDSETRYTSDATGQYQGNAYQVKHDVEINEITVMFHPHATVNLFIYCFILERQAGSDRFLFVPENTTRRRSHHIDSVAANQDHTLTLDMSNDPFRLSRDEYFGVAIGVSGHSTFHNWVRWTYNRHNPTANFDPWTYQEAMRGTSPLHVDQATWNEPYTSSGLWLEIDYGLSLDAQAVVDVHGNDEHVTGVAGSVDTSGNMTLTLSRALGENLASSVDLAIGPQVTSDERTAGTATSIRRYSPADVATMVTAHAPTPGMQSGISVASESHVLYRYEVPGWTAVAPTGTWGDSGFTGLGTDPTAGWVTDVGTHTLPSGDVTWYATATSSYANGAWTTGTWVMRPGGSAFRQQYSADSVAWHDTFNSSTDLWTRLRQADGTWGPAIPLTREASLSWRDLTGWKFPFYNGWTATPRRFSVTEFDLNDYHNILVQGYFFSGWSGGGQAGVYAGQEALLPYGLTNLRRTANSDDDWSHYQTIEYNFADTDWTDDTVEAALRRTRAYRVILDTRNGMNVQLGNSEVAAADVDNERHTFLLGLESVNDSGGNDFASRVRALRIGFPHGGGTVGYQYTAMRLMGR